MYHESIWCLLPIFLTLFLAFKTQKVLISLGAGIICGIIIFSSTNLNLYLSQILKLLLLFKDVDNLLLIIFPPLIGIMTQAMIENGGMNSLIKTLEPSIKDKKGAQLSAFYTGIILFFDDYASALILGSAYKRVFEKYKIAREKLAFIVDSTAAPIAAYSVFSTWIGFELAQMKHVATTTASKSAPIVLFIQTLPYAFYPITTLFFIYFLLKKEVGFGQMKIFEEKINQLEPSKKESFSSNKYFAIIPISAMIITTFISMILFYKIKHEVDSFWSILIGASIGMFLSLYFLPSKKHLKITLKKGTLSMIEPTFILIFAVMLGMVIKELKVASFLYHILPHETNLHLFPFVIFILAGIISFATGTSYGAMSILFPTIIPVVWQMMINQNINNFNNISACSAAIIGGAIFGDHCSPISDTTILSAASTRTNTIEHAKTQLPYGLVIFSITALAILIQSIWIDQFWIGFIISISFSYISVKILGKKIND